MILLENTCLNNPDNNIDTIIDKIYSGQWLIYGSRKNGEDTRYSLTYSYEWNYNENIRIRCRFTNKFIFNKK